MQDKICTQCKEPLPATSEFFYWLNGDHTRLRSECKHCTVERNKERRMGEPIRQRDKPGRKLKAAPPKYTKTPDGMLEVAKKQCPKCETPKPVTEFYNGYSYCKVCHRNVMKRSRKRRANVNWIDANQQRVLLCIASRREAGESDEQIKQEYLIDKLNATPEQIQNLFDKAS